MYRVIIPRRVERQLEQLPPDVHARLMPGLLALTGDPQPPGSRKLFGYERTWCAYLPDHYRVYYDIDPDRAVILILAIVQSRLDRKRLPSDADD